ncbi:SCO family protein [Desulfobulbus rhabdoformis]|uniref:SCO family protein n=1 Tax=Desulfobulbus rhabdoformis TaxID=34032 RepID=UPI001963E885|nr:SCO family protein [Desulfobulbus rhabdoformis]
MFNRPIPILLVLLLGFIWTLPAGGEEDSPFHGQQAAVSGIDQLQAPRDWVEEKTGAYLPLDSFFYDEEGRRVRLGQLIDRPTLLLPVYYTCPSICSFDQANLADTIRRLSKKGVHGFHVLSLSFDEEETPEIARQAKPNYTHLFQDDFPEENWTFLTGDKGNIRRVTDAIGYRFARQSDGVFLHPSALVAVAKDGQIIKYVYGAFIPGDVELALKEAAEGRPSTSIRRLLAFCFPANPRQNALVFKILKVASGVVLVGGGIWLFRLLRKKKSS